MSGGFVSLVIRFVPRVYSLDPCCRQGGVSVAAASASSTSRDCSQFEGTRNLSTTASAVWSALPDRRSPILPRSQEVAKVKMGKTTKKGSPSKRELNEVRGNQSRL